MDSEAVWQCFLETGDPVGYLLAKKLDQGQRRCDKRENREGEPPRPVD